MKYSKIILLGMMGSGKSTISKLLAKSLNFDLFELDEIFEQQEKIKIKDYFSNFGEENFRIIENKILNEFIKNENCVISTGGGIILKKENRELLFQENNLTIYLKASPKTIYNRIKNDKTRPLLLVENPKKEIEKILNKREEQYKKAIVTISTDNKAKEDIAKEILKIYG